MAVNAFTLFGTLSIDSSQFQTALNKAESKLKTTKQSLDAVETATVKAGQATAQSSRNFEKLNQALDQETKKLKALVDAYTGGKINANQFAQALTKVYSAADKVGNSAKDAGAKVNDLARKLQDAKAKTEAASKAAQDKAKADAAMKAATEAAKTASKAAADAQKAEAKALKDATDAAKRKADAQRNLGSKISSTGDAIKSFGTDLTYLVTVPLAALGGLAFAAATKIDALRNSMTAASGSVGAANEKLDHFIQMAQESPGVFVDMAARLYSAFKPMGVGDTVIDQVIKAFGRLKTAEANFDPDQFRLNLSQLFGQNFEMQDLKQALTFFPRFGELVAKQFGFKSSDLATIQAGFQDLKKQGLMSYQDFVSGIADAVNNDPTFGLLRETLGNRFMKMFERVQFALEPLGQTIANILEPAFLRIVDALKFVSDAFSSLSPTAQTVIVVIGGLVASIGLFLAVIGTIVAVIGGFIAALGVVATAIGTTLLPAFAAIAAISVGVIATFVALGAAAYALYNAYQTNFGGLHDVVDQTLSTISVLLINFKNDIVSVFTDAFQPLIDSVNDAGDIVPKVLNGLQIYLSMNFKAIGQTIQFLVALVTTSLRITATIIATNIKFIISLTSDLISAFRRIGQAFAILRADGETDWKALASTLKAGMLDLITFLTRTVNLIPGIILGALESLFPNIQDWANRLIGWFESIGADIPAAIARGILKNADIAKKAIDYAMGRSNEQPSTETKGQGGRMQGAPNREAERIGGSIGGSRRSGGTKQIDEYSRAIANLTDQYNRLNVETQLENVILDIAAGKFGKLTAEQARQLTTLASLIDKKTAGIKKQQDEDAIVADATSTIASLRLELESLNATTEVELALIALKGEEYRKLPPALFEQIKALRISIAEQKDAAKAAKAMEQADESARSAIERLTAAEENKKSILEQVNDEIKKATDAGNIYSDTQLKIWRDAAKAADALKLQQVGMDKLTQLMQDLGLATQPTVSAVDQLKKIIDEMPTALDAMADQLGITTEALKQMLMVAAKEKDSPTFLGQLSKQLDDIRKKTTDWSTAWATSLTTALEGIGNVFGNAIANWDGTAQGFFKSLAQGFRQLIGQIIGELVRLAAMRLVMMLVGSMIGGATASGNTGANAAGGSSLPAGGPAAAAVPKALGGLVTGPGSGTSDSIPAMLSNGEYVIPANVVKTLGVGFFESLRNGQFSAGATMPSVSNVSDNRSSSVSNSNVFNINVAGGMGTQNTGSMIQQEILKGLKKVEKRNR